jgi:hypothetical protein
MESNKVKSGRSTRGMTLEQWAVKQKRWHGRLENREDNETLVAAEAVEERQYTDAEARQLAAVFKVIAEERAARERVAINEWEAALKEPPAERLQSDRRRVAAASATCFVYLLQCESYLKIGKTTVLSLRIETLRCANPYDIKLVHSFETLARHGVEAALHEMFDQFRHRNEWYRLPAGAVTFISSLTRQNYLRALGDLCRPD